MKNYINESEFQIKGNQHYKNNENAFRLTLNAIPPTNIRYGIFTRPSIVNELSVMPA